MAVLLGLISAIGLFLSIWVLVTAPTMKLYPLSVGAPEVSPWLGIANGVILLLSVLLLRSGWLKWSVLVCSTVALLSSALPLIQFSSANQSIAAAMQNTLGSDYLAKVSPEQQAQMRPRPFDLMDALRGIPQSSIRLSGNIVFATPDQIPLTLDVYRPPQVGKHPAVIVIHGGAWQSGSPQDHPEFNRYLAAQGYTVVAISYRLAPTYRFPAQLEDVKAAFQFIQQHAEEYEIDRDRIVMMGRSAGAHLAMLFAYQPDAPPLKAVINYYGPVNLVEGYWDLPTPDPLDIRQILETFLGGDPNELPVQYQNASPIHLVAPQKPATLLIYGSRDHIVKAKFGHALYDRLRQQRNVAVFIEIPWAEHAFDAVFSGVSSQLSLYYTERFVAWALQNKI